jgi:hypothetical protein
VNDLTFSLKASDFKLISSVRFTLIKSNRWYSLQFPVAMHQLDIQQVIKNCVQSGRYELTTWQYVFITSVPQTWF